jgi:hypothetical protein
MKFNIEIPNEIIEEMTETIESYNFITKVPAEVLSTVLMLWMDDNGMLVRDDWQIIESRIRIEEHDT